MGRKKTSNYESAAQKENVLPREEVSGRKVIRSFTASAQDVEMLGALARYHGFSKSSTITSLVRKEFWRIFPKRYRFHLS